VRDRSGNENYGFLTFNGTGFNPATSKMIGMRGQALNLRTNGNSGAFDRVNFGSASIPRGQSSTLS
jgi:hypothetical protein